MTNDRRAARSALGAVAAAIVTFGSFAAGQQPAPDPSAQSPGPNGPYNQRDLQVARPFGGRARAEVQRALEGSVDIHMHTHPDTAERPVDAFEAATLAKKYGLRAIVLKNHYEPTAAQAYLMRRHVPGIEIFGGMTLDLTNGGVNPAAVDHMAKLEGGFGRIVWMPTYDAEAVVRTSKQPNRPFAAVSRDGKLLPDALAVLALIAKYNLVLATGHVSPEEGLTLVREGRRLGVRHMVVTHAMDQDWTVPQMREAARLGAFIEWAKPLGQPTIDQYAEGIRQVGPEFCIVSQLGVSHLPADLVGAFAVALLERGFTEGDLARMMKENPARLLGLSGR